MIKNLSPFLILVALLVSSCSANTTVSTEPALSTSDQDVENMGSPSAVSPTGERIESLIPPEITPEPSPSIGISFATDVLPILQSRCVICHGEDRKEQGLDTTSYSALIAGSDNGPVVVANNADNSLIVELVLAGDMPKRAPKLIPAQVQTLINWINQGALDN